MLSHSNKFIEYKYDESHWAVDNLSSGTCLAFVKFRNKYNYVMKLNPSDCRGYRSLMCFIGDDTTDIQHAFNREYTVAEQRGLSDVTIIMTEVYKKLGLAIVQTIQAGNNAHSLLPSGVVQIGSEAEPNLLHTHMWARGNPEQEYILGIPLRGPNPGNVFEMKAKNPNVPSLVPSDKIRWKPKELEQALLVMKSILHDYCCSSEFQEEFGGILTIDICQSNKPLEKPAVSAGESLLHRTLFVSQQENLNDQNKKPIIVSDNYHVHSPSNKS